MATKTAKYYDKSYRIIRDNSSVLEVRGKNAHVVIVLKSEKWGGDDDYFQQKTEIISTVRLAGLYAQKNKSLPRAPKGYTRKMLCWALTKLINNRKITNNSIFVLEADGSDNDELVEMYERMGFKFLSKSISLSN